MEGNLLKWTNYVFGWRERYFVLKGSVLLYYIRKGDAARGKIHLGVATLNVTANDYRFEIDTGSAIFYLRAETKEKKDEWVKAIKLAKFEAESKMKNIAGKNINITNIGENTMRMPNESYNIDTNRMTMIQDDKLTKKIIFIKSLTENMANLNLDLENFLTQNKQNFTSDNYSSLLDFLNTYKVSLIILLNYYFIIISFFIHNEIKYFFQRKKLDLSMHKSRN